MILQALATTNFLLGAYDTWLTQKRMKAFGVNFELNKLVKLLSTRLGPESASVIGVLGPLVGWTYIFFYFNLPVCLAIMVGYGFKRFELQLASRVYEQKVLEMTRMINEFRGSGATLPPAESTAQDSRLNSKEGK